MVVAQGDEPLAAHVPNQFAGGERLVLPTRKKPTNYIGIPGPDAFFVFKK